MDFSPASDTAITTSIVSTTQPTTTAAETSTTVPVASSETSIEAGTTTAIASDSATTSEAETTTTAEITTTTSQAESTTTAAVATPTFTIVGGGGSVQGQPLKGVDQEGSVFLFNPNTQFGNIVTRTFILDPHTGRLRDKNTGTLVCAYYGSSDTPSDPAYIGYCQTGNTGPNRYYDYLTCQVVSGKLACTAPKAACPTDDEDFQVCATQPGSDVNNQFYYRFSAGNGYYLHISSGSPAGYTPIDVLAEES